MDRDTQVILTEISLLLESHMKIMKDQNELIKKHTEFIIGIERRIEILEEKIVGGKSIKTSSHNHH